jgi:pimeloyl-ACP methyl ester carboxylesterase
VQADDASPPVVCVHGLGGSHQNWLALGPLLARRHEVYAPDLPGFGLTPPAGRSTTVEAHQRLLDAFIEAVVGERPVILVGNSMGGLVTMLEAAARPARIHGLVLIDPALPTPAMRLDRVVALNFAAFALPGIGERLLRRRQQKLSAAAQVEQTMSLVFADPSRVDPELRHRAEELAQRRLAFDWATPAFLACARSLLASLARRRAHRRRVQQLTPPVLVLHGDRDRLVHVEAATALVRLRPDWELIVLSDVGHVPQLEAPQRVAELVEDWVDRLAAGPAGAGRPPRTVEVRR